MDNDSHRSVSNDVADWLMAWHHDQLHFVGRLARTGSLLPKRLERFCKDSFHYNQSTYPNCYANRRRTAHLPLCCARLGLLRAERASVIFASVYETIQFIKGYIMLSVAKHSTLTSETLRSQQALPQSDK